MNKKFMVYINEKFEPFIVLAIVDFHKHIDFPCECGRCVCRCGGGWWQVTKDGILRLYDKSEDFGKYDEKYTKIAFDKKNVFYFDDPAIEDFKITKLILE